MVPERVVNLTGCWFTFGVLFLYLRKLFGMAKTKTAKTKVTKETYIEWYRLMLRIRRVEEKAGQMYGQQKIRGFLHLYIGQEAIAAGTWSATRNTDPIITAYRDHGLAMIRGVSANAAMAELYGKETGCTGGKGGSMHFFNVPENMYGGHGIVGGHIPLGAGLAFAEKYKGTDNVALCYMGDGAVRQGVFHEAINMAALWKLPVIYIIENNGYAMGTAVRRSGSVEELYKLGCAFDIPSKPVNAMHPLDVHNALEEALDHCRKGNGPVLLEFRTYRYKGHSMSDPAKYRTKDELEQYKDQDPIPAIAHELLDKGWIDEAGLKAIQDEIKAEVEESVRFAEESNYPPESALFEGIYTQQDYPYITD